MFLIHTLFLIQLDVNSDNIKGYEHNCNLTFLKYIFTDFRQEKRGGEK